MARRRTRAPEVEPSAPVDLERRWRELGRFGLAWTDAAEPLPHRLLWLRLNGGSQPLPARIEQVEAVLAEQGRLEAFEAHLAHLDEAAARWRR